MVNIPLKEVYMLVSMGWLNSPLNKSGISKPI